MKTLGSRYVRRVLVPVMAVSLLSACTYWKVEEMAPSQVVTEKEPGRVRLTMLDGHRIQMSDPTVSDSEIIGHPRRNTGGRYRVIKSDTLRVATDSVAHIEIRKTHPLDTAVAVLLGVGAFAAVVVLSSWDWGL